MLESRLRVVIDADPGHDDAIAILLAAKTLDVRAITTVHGNAPLEHTTENARRIVELAGLAGIPIAAGAARPLVREPRYAPEVHGITGLDGPDLPEATTVVLSEDAADLIIRLSHEVADLHLVAIGPLTNVATAFARDPSLAWRLGRVTLMGGSLLWGNVTPAAEFNILCDPEAAAAVFKAGAPITMIGLNVTMQVLGTPDRREALRALRTRTATVVADILDHYGAGEAYYTGLPGAALHDPLAIAALVDPTLFETVPLAVVVETSGDHTAGMTLCDGRRLGPDMRPRADYARWNAASPNADVAISVDVDRFWALLLGVLATYD